MPETTVPSAIPQYVVIGHVTRDVMPDDTYRAGGTATYAALAMDSLGLRVGVLTSASCEWPLFPERPSIQVVCRSSACTTTFENIYTSGKRRQYIRAVAEGLTAADLPAGWRDVALVHLGPVAQEVSYDLATAFSRGLVVVTPQGWLRHWDGQGLVSPVDWSSDEAILSVTDAVVLSIEDLGNDRQRLAGYVRRARLLVLTVGQQGAIVYQEGREQRVPAFVANEVDPTGAGDVFAAAFLVRLAASRDAIDAARFANCVASFVVESPGTTNMPSMAQVEWRLQHGRLRP